MIFVDAVVIGSPACAQLVLRVLQGLVVLAQLRRALGHGRSLLLHGGKGIPGGLGIKSLLSQATFDHGDGGLNLHQPGVELDGGSGGAGLLGLGLSLKDLGLLGL